MEESLSNNKTEKADSGLIDDILNAIKSVKYGYVQIIIQDSKIVQIEKTEKFRFNRWSNSQKR